MSWEARFRRAVHLSAPAFLVYYLLPSPLWTGGPPREVALLAVLAVVMIFELLRLLYDIQVPGMRDYEQERISAMAWAAIALAIAMLFFPPGLTAPAVVGMALIDPLISHLRQTHWYPWVPLATYFLLVLTILILFYSLSPTVMLTAALASLLAVGVEAIRTRYVDDDFLMIIIPLLGMALVMAL